MPRVVVLGTGTGVGKTYFTVALARALAAGPARASVRALKPVETGFSGARRGTAPSDAERLRKASSAPGRDAPPLYALRDPVSPHLAARRANRPISLSKIRRWIRGSDLSDNALHDTIYWLLIETAGGALSPLSRTATNADLASALDPAFWILVAPDALGVLHDVRATLLALRDCAREPDYVVLSAARAKDASTGTNARELARLGIAKPIATLSRGTRSVGALAPLVSALRARART